jgi:hypothetical protein
MKIKIKYVKFISSNNLFFLFIASEGAKEATYRITYKLHISQLNFSSRNGFLFELMVIEINFFLEIIKSLILCISDLAKKIKNTQNFFHYLFC